MLYCILSLSMRLPSLNFNWRLKRNQTQQYFVVCLPVYHHLTKAGLGCYYLRDPGLSNPATAIQKADWRETRISTAAIESFWTVVRSFPLYELHPIAVGEPQKLFEMPMCCSCLEAPPATVPLLPLSPAIAGITDQKIYLCL